MATSKTLFDRVLHIDTSKPAQPHVAVFVTDLRNVIAEYIRDRANKPAGIVSIDVRIWGFESDGAA